MLFHPLNNDERTRSNTRYAATIWLGVTQVLLAGVIFFRLYITGQADEELRDFQFVLAVSIFGHLALQLFLGGVMPVPTWRGALVSWAVLAGAVAAVCLAIYGWPKPEQWTDTWLPALLGPALLIGMYALVAKAGQWRIDRKIQSQN